MPETAQVEPQPPLNQPVIAHKPRRRRLSEQDVEKMAELAAKRITDKDACGFLGINYGTWLQWKQRAKNDTRFAHIIARIRGSKLVANWDNIEKAGPKDWRASREMLALLAPDQFSDRDKAPIQVNVGISAQVHVDDIVTRAYLQREKAKAAITVSEVKALPEPKPDVI